MSYENSLLLVTASALESRKRETVRQSASNMSSPSGQLTSPFTLFAKTECRYLLSEPRVVSTTPSADSAEETGNTWVEERAPFQPSDFDAQSIASELPVVANAYALWSEGHITLSLEQLNNIIQECVTKTDIFHTLPFEFREALVQSIRRFGHSLTQQDTAADQAVRFFRTISSYPRAWTYIFYHRDSVSLRNFLPLLNIDSLLFDAASNLVKQHLADSNMSTAMVAQLCKCGIDGVRLLSDLVSTGNVSQADVALLVSSLQDQSVFDNKNPFVFQCLLQCAKRVAPSEATDIWRFTLGSLSRYSTQCHEKPIRYALEDTLRTTSPERFPALCFIMSEQIKILDDKPLSILRSILSNDDIWQLIKQAGQSRLLARLRNSCRKGKRIQQARKPGLLARLWNSCRKGKRIQQAWLAANDVESVMNRVNANEEVVSEEILSSSLDELKYYIRQGICPSGVECASFIHYVEESHPTSYERFRDLTSQFLKETVEGDQRDEVLDQCCIAAERLNEPDILVAALNRADLSSLAHCRASGYLLEILVDTDESRRLKAFNSCLQLVPSDRALDVIIVLCQLCHTVPVESNIPGVLQTIENNLKSSDESSSELLPAWVLCSQGDYHKALPVLGLLKTPFSKLLLARCLRYTCQYDGALKILSELTDCNMFTYLVRYERVKIYLRLQQFGVAFTELRSLLADIPSHLKALNWRRRLASARHDYALARSTRAEMEKLAPVASRCLIRKRKHLELQPHPSLANYKPYKQLIKDAQRELQTVRDFDSLNVFFEFLATRTSSEEAAVVRMELAKFQKRLAHGYTNEFALSARQCFDEVLEGRMFKEFSRRSSLIETDAQIRKNVRLEVPVQFKNEWTFPEFLNHVAQESFNPRGLVALGFGVDISSAYDTLVRVLGLRHFELFYVDFDLFDSSDSCLTPSFMKKLEEQDKDILFFVPNTMVGDHLVVRDELRWLFDNPTFAKQHAIAVYGAYERVPFLKATSNLTQLVKYWCSMYPNTDTEWFEEFTTENIASPSHPFEMAFIAITTIQYNSDTDGSGDSSSVQIPDEDNALRHWKLSLLHRIKRSLTGLKVDAEGFKSFLACWKEIKAKMDPASYQKIIHCIYRVIEGWFESAPLGPAELNDADISDLFTINGLSSEQFPSDFVTELKYRDEESTFCQYLRKLNSQFDDFYKYTKLGEGLDY